MKINIRARCTGEIKAGEWVIAINKSAGTWNNQAYIVDGINPKTGAVDLRVPNPGGGYYVKTNSHWLPGYLKAIPFGLKDFQYHTYQTSDHENKNP